MEHATSVTRELQSKVFDEGVLASLRETYRRRIESLTDDLGPRLRSGELRGFRAGDADGRRTPPRWQLEEECRRRLASTGADVFATLLCSEFAAWDFDSGWLHPAHHAGHAAALDVFAEAARRGWYKPDANEEPSLETLAEEAGEPLPDPLEEIEEAAAEGLGGQP